MAERNRRHHRCPADTESPKLQPTSTGHRLVGVSLVPFHEFSCDNTVQLHSLESLDLFAFCFKSPFSDSYESQGTMRTAAHQEPRHHCKFHHLLQHPHRADLQSKSKSGHVCPGLLLLIICRAFFSCARFNPLPDETTGRFGGAILSLHARFTPLPDVTPGRYGSAALSLYVRFTPLLEEAPGEI